MPGAWIGQPRLVLAGQCDRIAGHQLESGDPVAEGLPQVAEQMHAGADVRQRGERGDAGLRQRVQSEDRGGNDAERALGADEKLLHVVSRIVLAQAAQSVPDPAVGEHDFDAENELARIAEAQHRGASGIGRQVAADRAAAFGGKR